MADADLPASRWPCSALHLHHGIWSALQTLGFTNTPRPRRAPRSVGLVARRWSSPAASRSSRSSSSPASSPSKGSHAHDRHARHHAHRRPVDHEDAQAADDAAGYYTPGEPLADTKAPGGPLEERWETRKFEARIANPANRRKLSIIVVGTGLAGASAAATLGEAGYVVKSFCYQDSPRRAHSIAAQGGINAAKNYKERRRLASTGSSTTPSRAATTARASPTSTAWPRSAANIIDQCVAQGVPFAREYGGLLDNRSFGGVQVSRTFYARGQTGQQLLIGAYQALERQVAAGTVTMLHPPRDARADRRRRPGPRHHRPRHGHRRDRDPLRRRRRARHRRLRQRLLPLHQRDGLQRHRDLAGAPQGRLHGQPLLHPDPPDLHPGLRRRTSRS